MSEQQFDPYRIWFGIPPQHQPPNHYRLLGIELFESDAEVIAHAADQRMVHLKTFASGKHSALSQKLLNEVAAARVCLLNPVEKAKYDAALRWQTTPPASAVPPSCPVPPPPPPPARNEDSGTFDALAESFAVPSTPRGASRTQQKKKRAMGIWLPLAIAAIALGLLGALVVANLPQDSGAQLASLVGNGQEAGASKDAPDAPAKDSPSSATETGNGAEKPTKVDPKPDPEPVVETPDASKVKKDPPVAEPPKADPPAEDPPVKPQESPPALPVDPLPAKETPEVKSDVPDDGALKAADKEIRDLFKDEIKDAVKPEQKLAMAAKLKKMAAESKPGSASHYALLRMAVAYGLDGNDVEGSLPLIDEMARNYDVNAVELKTAALTRAEAVAAKLGPQASQAFLAFIRKYTEDALAAGEIEAAGQSLKVAEKAAIHLADIPSRKQIQDTLKEIDRLKSQAAAAKAATDSLKAEPDNAAANGEAGRWNCFVCGDWKTGLPQLAKGDDEALRDLAKLDLAAPSASDKQMALGDGWLAQSAGKKGLELMRLQEHAAAWYRKALPRLSGLDRVKVEQKLEKTGIRLSTHALKFDGWKSYVLVRNFAYPNNQPITIEAIVKCGGNDTNYAQQTIFGTGSWPGFHLSKSGPTLNFDFTSNDSSSPTLQKWTPVKPGVWNHVAIEFDGSKKRLFLNGQEINQRAASGPYQASANPLLIGAQPGRASHGKPAAPTQFFTGEIRGLRISSTVRYLRDFTPPTELNTDSSTRLLYQFTEGKGNVLKDTSGRGKLHGEIVDAQWVKVDDLTIGGDAKVAPAAPATPAAPAVPATPPAAPALPKAAP